MIARCVGAAKWFAGGEIEEDGGGASRGIPIRNSSSRRVRTKGGVIIRIPIRVGLRIRTINALNVENVHTANRTGAVIVLEVDMVGDVLRALCLNDSDDSGVVHPGEADWINVMRIGKRGHIVDDVVPVLVLKGIALH